MCVMCMRLGYLCGWCASRKMPAGNCIKCGGYASDGVMCARCKSGK